ncbi:MAG: bifunctional UDP-sugar hydrolase/5'-nucleotidase [Candidatus Gastranaerophilales bacterium]|nr:bifunctional UDP-sugar hydrolase/5'-nucleotidase [Candidatus Gastranaerophilales bacterium]
MFKRRLLLLLAVIFCSVNLAFGYELTILHSNDIHGRIEPISYKDSKPLGGWARRAGLIKEIESKKENTLILDAGDIYQGSVYYQIYEGMPEMNFLDQAGYDAICVGNHELDKGLDAFENLTKLTSVPFLGANVEFSSNFYLNGKIKSHITKDLNGFKVGVIGMTTPELKHLSAYSDYINQPDYYKTLQFFINYLKNDVDLLVLLSHSGVEQDIETAKNVDGLDVIVGGHSHTFMEKPYCAVKNGRKTLVVQAGEFGIKLGELDIEFNEKGIQKYTYQLIPLDETVPTDKKIEKKIAELNTGLERIKNEKLGELKSPLDCTSASLSKTLTNSGALVLEAISKASNDIDAVMINAGTIRGNKILPKGKITKMDVIEMLPFANKMVIVDLKGKDIKSILETSARYAPNRNEAFLQTKGLSYTIDTKQPAQALSPDLEKVTKEGCRVKDVKINNKPLDEEATYKILTTDFLYSGGNGYFQFKKSPDYRRIDFYVTNAVVEYIKQNKKINPRPKDKVIVEE